MIFDSTLLAAVASEMRARFKNNAHNAILRDIWQSENDERRLFLQFRDATFLVDTHPHRASCYFVENALRADNTPLSAALRKALRGAQLVKISQPNFDRILRMEFLTRADENADAATSSTRYALVLEMMDRRANAILLDENNVIIDAVKRLPPFLNRARTVLPHQLYIPPPSSRENPLLVENWRERLSDFSQTKDLNLVLWLRDHFTGVSPLVARDIERFLETYLYKFEGEPFGSAEAEAQTCEYIWTKARKAAHGDYQAFLCGAQPYPFDFDARCVSSHLSISALLEDCAQQNGADRVLDDGRSALLSHLHKKLKSNATQISAAQNAATHAQEAEKYLRMGNLILMRAPQVEAAIDAKSSSVTLHDEENIAHEIALESDWNVGDNALRWFNRYKRAQKISADAPQRLQALETERARLQSWKTQAEAATSEELEALAQQIGWSRDEKKAVSRTRQQEASSRPENRVRRNEIDGWTVFLGRSAIENQLLLSKIARPADIWMHVRDAPSAHVIIKNQKGANVPERVLDEAARWLAQTSRRGKSGDVLEIIYTPAKFVRAIKGAPGRVTLARFQTRLVTT